MNTKSNIAVVVEADQVIVSMRKAHMALAEAQTIQQTKKILDVAAAAEIYARRQKLGDEAMDVALSIKVEALRKLGEMLQVTPKAEGAKGIGKKSAVPEENRTLAELGLTKKESAVAQKLAALPEAQFQQVRDGHVTVAKAIAAVDAAKKPAPAAEQPVPADAKAPEPVLPADDFAPTDEELYEAEEAAKADAERIRLMLESDEPLADANAKLTQQAAMIAKLNWRINSLLTENADLLRRLKRAQDMIDRLSKQAA